MIVAFHTLGCKVNQYETEALKERFAARGHRIAADGERADLYVINSCTVTNLADRKSRQFIGRARREAPEALIAVIGCYAQVKPNELASMEGVDLVVGINEKQRLPEIAEEYMSGRDPSAIHVLPRWELTDYRSDGIIRAMDSRRRAYIKIEEGCDRFCTYCIIPYARGRVRSRSPEEIFEEAAGLVKAGFREIVLTGINTALYGRDLGLRGVEPLIAGLDAMPGDFRIRLSSLEPTVVDAAYVKGLLAYPRLCHHMHLAVQSGADHVLGMMDRHYTRADFMDIVRVLRAADPHYGISTDIIAGFPGETEKDFAGSLSLVTEAGLCRTHVFKYSKRDGTPAAGMPDQVPDRVKNFRSAELIKIGQAAAAEFCRRSRGELREVLFEREEEGYWSGYTDNYIKVYAVSAGEPPAGLTRVRLLTEFRDGMLGEPAGPAGRRAG